MENETFISSVAWIHRGYAARVPVEFQADAEEIEDLKRDPMVAEQLQGKQVNEMDEQMLDEQMNEDGFNVPMFSQNIPSSSAKYPNAVDDFEEDEKEDYYIQQTDALIVAGKIEKEQASLEVYVYEQEKNNLYVHHEVMLSAFPLSIEWLNCSLGSIMQQGAKLEKGNYAIVSTFLPQIEIWNLDQVDAVEPELILGGQAVSNKRKPKKFTNKAKKWKQGSHTDSVLSLSLNPINKNVLASGSADCTLKIWDLCSAKNIFTSNHHQGRVQKVKWNPTDFSVLFTTSEDGRVAILDSRFPNDTIYHKIGSGQKLESACWNKNQTAQIAYGTDKGNLHLIDVRSLEKPIISAPVHHGNQVSDLKIGSKNVCYTCSEDETVRVWNLNDFSAPIAHRKPNCGKMYCLDVYETEEGPILSCGNAKGELFVWDVTQNQQFNNYWKAN